MGKVFALAAPDRSLILPEPAAGIRGPRAQRQASALETLEALGLYAHVVLAGLYGREDEVAVRICACGELSAGQILC